MCFGSRDGREQVSVMHAALIGHDCADDQPQCVSSPNFLPIFAVSSKQIPPVVSFVRRCELEA